MNYKEYFQEYTEFVSLGEVDYHSFGSIDNDNEGKTVDYVVGYKNNKLVSHMKYTRLLGFCLVFKNGVSHYDKEFSNFIHNLKIWLGTKAK